MMDPNLLRMNAPAKNFNYDENGFRAEDAYTTIGNYSGENQTTKQHESAQRITTSKKKAAVIADNKEGKA